MNSNVNEVQILIDIDGLDIAKCEYLENLGFGFNKKHAFAKLSKQEFVTLLQNIEHSKIFVDGD